MLEKKKKQQNGGIYENTTSTYRIVSRAFCNFVFPNQVDEETNIMIEGASSMRTIVTKVRIVRFSGT